MKTADRTLVKKAIEYYLRKQGMLSHRAAREEQANYKRILVDIENAERADRYEQGDAIVFRAEFDPRFRLVSEHSTLHHGYVEADEPDKPLAVRVAEGVVYIGREQVVR